MAENVFPSKDMVKLSMDFVAVIAHNDDGHTEGDYIVNGEKKHMCGIYDLPDCQSHKQMAQAVSQKGLAPGMRGTPTHWIFDPKDLSTPLHTAHSMSASQIEDAIAEAQKKIGKPVLWKDYSKMSKAIEETKRLIAEKDYRKALAELKDLDPKGLANIEAEKKALTEQIFEAGRALLKEAEELIDGGDVAAAKKILLSVRSEFNRTPVEDEASALLDKLKDEAK